MEGLETTSGGAAGAKGTGGTEEGDGGGLDELLGDDLGDEDMEVLGDSEVTALRFGFSWEGNLKVMLRSTGVLAMGVLV
ncbi:hypothetical protein DL769_004881 [Monosporascus sp. CRB-8-3]|nr:hypothetical protein DL769_004881 [Monosporascus sp. CRB-8-3]